VSVTLRTAIPTLFALLLGFGLIQMGNTLQGTLLSLRATAEGFAPRGLSHTLAAAQILIAGWGFYRLTKRSAPADQHKGHFLVESNGSGWDGVRAGTFGHELDCARGLSQRLRKAGS
jgi:hypothetical protein